MCDDGNTLNGDGCSSICRIENGWECTSNSSNGASTCDLSHSFVPKISVESVKKVPK